MLSAESCLPNYKPKATRIMERGQRTYKIWARERIRKQEQELERLLKQREEQQQTLAAHNRLFYKQQDKKDAECFQALLQQRDSLKEAQKQKDLHHDQISTQPRPTGVRTSKSGKLKPGRTHRAKHIWEDKLNRASICFNELLTKNSHLRDELDSLDADRVHFHQLHNRLNTELQEVNQKIEESFDQCAAAYNEKMEVRSKMTVMKEKEYKEFAQDDAKIKEFNRLQAHEFKLKKFMSIKCRSRSRQDNQLTHTQQLETRERKKVDSGEESQDALKEMFDRIQSVTGEENLDLLDTRFIQAEDRNFALFSFVNEQSNEIEALKDNIHQIQEKMKQLGVKDAQEEQDHCYFLGEYDEQLKETRSQAEDCENQVNTLSKTLDESKTELSSILSKLDCDLSVIEDKLGTSAGITDSNIVLYLGVVEQQINELLTIKAFLNSKVLEKDYSSKDQLDQGQNPKQIQQSRCVEPVVNSVKVDADEPAVADDEDWPLTQEELRRRIMKGVLQKDLAKPAVLRFSSFSD